MHSKHIVTIYFTVLFVIFAVAADAKKMTVEWKNFVVYQENGTYHNPHGVGDGLLHFYERHMSEWEHLHEYQPLARLFVNMATKKQGALCCPLKTGIDGEIASELLRSDRVVALSPPGIVVRTEDIGTVFSADGVSLQNLLRDSSLKTVWINKSTSTPAIRALMEKYKDSSNVILRSNDSGSFVEMLKWKRIDYFIEHGIGYTLKKRKRPELEGVVTFLPIHEAEAPVPTYTFCNKSPEGRKVIDAVNSLLTTDEYRQYLRMLIMRFYPEELRKTYLRYHGL